MNRATVVPSTGGHPSARFSSWPPFIESRPGLIAGASAASMGIAGVYGVLKPNEMVLKSKAKWWVMVLLFTSAAAIFLVPQSLDSGIAHIMGILTGNLAGLWFKKERSLPKLTSTA